MSSVDDEYSQFVTWWEKHHGPLSPEQEAEAKFIHDYLDDNLIVLEHLKKEVMIDYMNGVLRLKWFTDDVKLKDQG